MNHSDEALATARTGYGVKRHLLMVALLVVTVLVSHGPSLWDGLFFDDHWHRSVSREYGWSFTDLVKSGTVDLSGKLNHLWWQTDKMVWQYARPVAMLITKIEYYAAGGARSDPMAIHAFAIFWHWATSLFVYGLACWAGLKPRWALVAGIMFLIMPHSFFTVGWAAARNALVGGMFFAASVLCYAHASLGRPDRSRASRGLLFGLAFALWILALLSRETALVLPGVIFLLDWTVGGTRHLLRRLPFHLPLWILCLAFVYWRVNYFSVDVVPEIYLTRPEGWDDLTYYRWAAIKLIHLLFCLTVYTPMLMGIATYEGVEKNWTILLVMTAVVLLIAVWYVAVSRGKRGRWVWPAWVVAAFLPVVPVFEMPHFGYLPAIPYAIMIAIVLSRLPVRVKPAVVTLVIIGTVWSLVLYHVLWWGTVRSEQLVYENIQATSPPPEPGAHRKMFFINLPIVAIYTPVAMREIWDFPVENLDGYVLTFAPHPLMMRKPSTVEQLDDHTLVVSTPPPGYFSGRPGQMLIDGSRSGEPLLTNDEINPGDTGFRVLVLDGDESGVRKLKFAFERPLASSNYWFYVSTPDMPAYLLRFDRQPQRLSPDDEALFEHALSQDTQIRATARAKIRELALPVARAMADPIRDELHLQSDASLSRVRDWWQRNEVRAQHELIAAFKQEYDTMFEQRQAFYELVKVARRVIRSDLFLTGGER